MNSTFDSITKLITVVRCIFFVFSLYKLKALIHGCREATQVRCLIFVERIITAKVIERIMKKMTRFSHFSIAYLTGTNTSVDALTPKVQKETLRSFLSGKVLTCTSHYIWHKYFLVSPLTSWSLILYFPLFCYDHRSIYYLPLMWLRRELMCHTVPL